MINIETTLRGILEKETETITNPNILQNLSTRFQNLLTKSIEDCLFGVVVGFLWGRFASLITVRHGRFPTDAEIHEFWEMIEKRTMYIKGRIKLATSR